MSKPPYPVVGTIKSFQSIKPQSSSSTVNGTGVDTTGYEEAIIVLDCGTTTATGTLDVKVQDSADNSSFADIAGGGVSFTQVVPANDDAIYVGVVRLSDNNIRRYIRVVGVAATAASIYGASIHLARATAVPAQTPQWTK